MQFQYDPVRVYLFYGLLGVDAAPSLGPERRKRPRISRNPSLTGRLSPFPWQRMSARILELERLPCADDPPGISCCPPREGLFFRSAGPADDVHRVGGSRLRTHVCARVAQRAAYALRG